MPPTSANASASARLIPSDAAGAGARSSAGAGASADLRAGDDRPVHRDVDRRRARIAPEAVGGGHHTRELAERSRQRARDGQREHVARHPRARAVCACDGSMRSIAFAKKRIAPGSAAPAVGTSFSAIVAPRPSALACQPASGLGSAARAAAMGPPQRGSGSAVVATGKREREVGALRNARLAADEPVGARRKRRLRARGKRRRRPSVRRDAGPRPRSRS